RRLDGAAEPEGARGPPRLQARSQPGRSRARQPVAVRAHGLLLRGSGGLAPRRPGLEPDRDAQGHLGEDRRPPALTRSYVQSGFFGTPLQGLAIVGCSPGTGCGTDVRICDSICFFRMNASPALPGFGVVASLQAQVTWMFAGDEVVSALLDTQLLTD